MRAKPGVVRTLAVVPMVLLLAGCSAFAGGRERPQAPTAPPRATASATQGAAAPGPEGCAGRRGQEIPAVEVPAVHAAPVAIPAATVDGHQVAAASVPGVDIPAQRIPAQCAVEEAAPAGCLGAVQVPGVTVPGVTIPGVTVPGVPEAGIEPVSTPPVSAQPVSTPPVGEHEVCTRKVRQGLRPSVLRPSVLRPSVLRPSVLRPSLLRPSKCVNGQCIPAVNVPAVVVPAVVVPAVVVPAGVIAAKVFPEVSSPGVNVSQGDGATVYTLQTDVLFDFDKADVRPDAAATLRQVVASIEKRFPDGRLQIDGHTDAKGDDAYNQDLSLRRARAVADWLVGKGGLDRDRMTVQGFGETKPVAPNTRPDGSDNPTGRAQNRRVAIAVRKA